MALLAFLAVEPRQPHRRERLADLLWPDASPAEGRHSLATALSVLRGKLGPRTFESTRETVRFVAPDLEVDLDRLARGDILGDDVTPPLEMGGFLDDFEVLRAPEFVLWRDLRRAHWFPAIRRAFIVLMDGCRRTGDFSRIELLADQLLVLDELCEDAIRAKMEGRAFAGDRMSAIRIYQEWRRKLEEELGATPSALLEGMALRLRQRGFEPPGSANVPTVLTDQWRDRAFVGRRAQYRVCYDHWEETRESRGRHILLLGDSGVGKTTLVERLVTAAGLEGAVSARVQCYEVEREIPYSAIGTLVRGMLDKPGATATAPEWLAELARAVPAVAQRFANLPAPRDTEGEAARLRLTEAVHQLATTIAEEHPLILVVDDVHLSDDASVAVLHLLMRRTQDQRIMVILGAREPELARSPNASRLQEVREALALRPVEVPPLTEEEMEEVMGAVAEAHQSRLTPAVRRALVRAAAGIPMIGELLFDDWRTHGDHCLALGIGAMTVDAEGVGQELYRELADRVMRGLSDIARGALNLAAILGDRLNDLAMYELVDLSLGQTLKGMAELTTQRVLRDNGRGLEFRNEVLRGYAYLSVPSPHRRVLHGLIADRLIASVATGQSVPGLTLAWHCYRAGKIDLAEPYLIVGAREALNHGGCFETELAVRSAMANLSPTYSQPATLLLIEALQDQGRWEESLELVSSQNSTTSTARAAFAVRARVHLARSQTEFASVADETTSILGCEAELRDKLPAIHAASFVVWHTQDAATYTELLTSLFKAANDPATKAGLVSTLLILSWRTGGIAALENMRGLAAEISAECEKAKLANGSRYHLENARACLEGSCGNYQLAMQMAMAAQAIAQQLGDDERNGITSSNIALYAGRLGDYKAQENWARKALHLLRNVPNSWKHQRIRFHVATALAMQGYNERALLEPLPSESTLVGAPKWMSQSDGLMRADVLQLCGRPELAARLATRTLRETSIEPLSQAYTGLVVRWLALVATDLASDTGQVEEVIRLTYQGIEQLDMVDQAEVCAAAKLTNKRLGGDWIEPANRLSARLSRLPVGVPNLLTRLGMSCYGT
ncbi:MAG: AAA family ATPase [Gemmatimonadales bacterium]